jgi:hypothetical protein
VAASDEGEPVLEILASSLSDATVEAFRTDATYLSAVYDALKTNLGLPDASVRLVLADDFVGRSNAISADRSVSRKAESSRRSGLAGWSPRRCSMTSTDGPV